MIFGRIRKVLKFAPGLVRPELVEGKGRPSLYFDRLSMKLWINLPLNISSQLC